MSCFRNNVIIATAVLGLLATGCSKKEAPAGTGSADAIGASNAWLAVIDAAKYDDSWERACVYFKGVVAKEQWVRQIAGVRGPLGSVRSREVTSSEYTTKLPGAPDGEYVVIQYRTSFENKVNAVETVTPMRDPDGVYRVSGYYIR